MKPRFKSQIPGAIFFALLMSTLVISAPMPGAAQAPNQEGRLTAESPIEVRTHLSPRRFTTLSSEMDGKIERLSVRDGDRIKRGQVLVKFDCGVEIAQRKKAKIIAQQAANVATAYDRLFTLKAKSELEVAEAKANAVAALAEALVMDETVSRCVITAPFSGRVFELFVRQYQYVSTGNPLLGLLDDRDLELELIVPSN